MTAAKRITAMRLNPTINTEMKKFGNSSWELDDHMKISFTDFLQQYPVCVPSQYGWIDFFDFMDLKWNLLA